MMDQRTHNSSDPDFAPVKDTVEARQGVTGHNVRYVLVIGTVAVIALFAVVYGFFV
jgi:hypothetical protein